MGGSSCYELMETNEGKLAYVYLFPMRHRVSCSSSWKFSTGIRAVCVLITASAFSTCHSVIIVSILTLFFFFFCCKTNDSKWFFKGMVFNSE